MRVAHHQTRGPYGCGLFILHIGAGIADMRVGQGDDLLRIGGVGKDFLITAHRGIKDHLTHRGALSTYRQAFENTAIFKDQYGRTEQANLQLISGITAAARARKKSEMGILISLFSHKFRPGYSQGYTVPEALAGRVKSGGRL